MPKKSNSWKDLEKQWRDMLNSVGLTAERLARGAAWSKKIHDVGVAEAEWLISDCKYSIHSFMTNRTTNALNRMLADVEDKYKTAPEQEVVVISKGYKERGAVASCDAKFMAKLLAFYILNNKESHGSEE